MNTETYKYYIDFAAKNGLDYIVLDEGWYELGDLLKVSPGMDIAELADYGRSKMAFPAGGGGGVGRTRVLDARIADYVLIARRSGDEWYVGAITD